MLDLGTERQMGFGIGAIPWSKIVEYGRHAGIMGAALDDFVMLIRRTDAEFVREWARLREKASSKAAPKPSGGRRTIGRGG